MSMSQFIVSILWVSAICGVFILGIWALSPALNKHFIAKWKYWAWILIALRLVVPINFGLPQFTAPVAMSEVISIQYMPVAELFTPAQLPPQADTTETLTYSPPSLIETITLYQVIFLIWIAGSIVFATIQIARYFTAKRKILRWSVASKRQEIDETLLSLSQEMGIKTTIYPMINKEVTSPMIMGLIRPVLMLPHEDYEINDLDFILRHELTHFKNKDIVYKVILFIANAIHWFNPIVYLMVQEAHADMERVCDGDVLKNRGAEERREYGEVILNSIGQRKMRGNVFTTNFYASTNKIKARFINIMDARKKKSGFVQLLVVAFSAIIFSGISPVMGYSVDAANAIQSPDSEQTRSYRFMSMIIDMQDIDTLEIHLQNCNLVVLKAEYWSLPGSQMRIVSNPAFSHSLTINQETRTAYIYNLSPVPSNNTHGLPDSLTIGVSADLGWTFARVNIHLENGNLRYLDVPVEDFLAKDLNINLVRGVTEEHFSVAPRTGRE